MTLPIPTQRSIGLHAERIRFFSAYADMEALIERIDNSPPQSPEDEVNLIIRDGLIDQMNRLAGVIDNLAKRAAVGELLDAADEREAA
jgi:hypothetical protein